MAQAAADPAQESPKAGIYIDIPLGPRRDAVVTEKGFQIRSPHTFFLYAGEGNDPMALQRTFDITFPSLFRVSYTRPSPNSRLWIAGVPYSVNILTDYHGPSSQGMVAKEIEEWYTSPQVAKGFYFGVHNQDRAPLSEIIMRYLHRRMDGAEREMWVRPVTDPATHESAGQALAKARCELEIDRVFLMYQTALSRFCNRSPSAQGTLENYLSFSW